MSIILYYFHLQDFDSTLDPMKYLIITEIVKRLLKYLFKIKRKVIYNCNYSNRKVIEFENTGKMKILFFLEIVTIVS